MKRWLFLTFIVGLIGLPGTMFLVNTLEATNEVHVTALVRDPNTIEETAVVTSTSGGGGAASSGSSSNEETSGSSQMVPKLMVIQLLMKM
jgi:hypothetical protein